MVWQKQRNAGDDRGRENRARILLVAKAEINDGGEMSVTNGDVRIKIG